MDVFNITYYSYIDIIINIDLSKQFIYNKSIPIFYYKNSEIGIDEESPFYSMLYNVTNIFEQMIIKTTDATSLLSEEYRDTFSFYLYKNFSDKLFIDTHYMANSNLLFLIGKGFKPCAFNIFEKLKFFWIQNHENKLNTINDFRWCDIDYLALYIIRPWFNNIIDILHNEANNFLNDAKVIQISLFIVIIFILIMSYFIIWKKYEESLSILLEKSIDLIQLMPEEIKNVIVRKFNE